MEFIIVPEVKSKLTKRQLEICELILAGFYEAKDIAKKVGCRHRTIKNHIRITYLKLGVNSKYVQRTQLICILLGKEPLIEEEVLPLEKLKSSSSPAFLSITDRSQKRLLRRKIQ